MPKLSTMRARTTHRILVYAPPKMGKTFSVGLLAKKFNLHWFDIENGINTLLSNPEHFPQELLERITCYQIPDSKIYPMAIETILKVIMGNPVEICEEHGKVGCPQCAKEGGATQRFCLKELGPEDILVIDSLNQLQLSAMNHITKGKPDLYKPDWEDFRNQGALMDKVLSVLQQTPCHVAVMTHETEAEMEDGSKKLVPIAGTVNFSRNTAKYFDHVVYITTRGTKRVMFSNELTNPKVTAGSRSSVDLSKEENPELLKFFGDIDYSKEAAAHVVKDEAAAALLDSAATLAANGIAAGKIPNPNQVGGGLTKPGSLGSMLGNKPASPQPK